MHQEDNKLCGTHLDSVIPSWTETWNSLCTFFFFFFVLSAGVLWRLWVAPLHKMTDGCDSSFRRPAHPHRPACLVAATWNRRLVAAAHTSLSLFFWGRSIEPASLKTLQIWCKSRILSPKIYFIAFIKLISFKKYMSLFVYCVKMC